MNFIRNEPSQNKSKQFDESMIEPVDNSFSQKSEMLNVGNAGNKRQRTGQHRAADGKFETGFAVNGRKST